MNIYIEHQHDHHHIDLDYIGILGITAQDRVTHTHIYIRISNDIELCIQIYIYNITELDVDLQQYCEYAHIDTIGCVVEKF